jgi:hypothetical protein
MPSFRKVVELWHRRLHYYLGLYFLFFLWLFSATGLMLNHQQWFRDLYERAEHSYDTSIEGPSGATDVERATDLMGQLNLRGEIEWPAAQPAGHLGFNVARPNRLAQVRVDLDAERASVMEFSNNGPQAFRIFHTFSGSRYNQPASREWVVTSVWVFAMDALAAGLIVMVLGSYYMWWRLKKRKAPGMAALCLGVASCAVFVAGLI